MSSPMSITSAPRYVTHVYQISDVGKIQFHKNYDFSHEGKQVFGLWLLKGHFYKIIKMLEIFVLQ
jgi:hypothetical protein